MFLKQCSLDYSIVLFLRIKLVWSPIWATRSRIDFHIITISLCTTAVLNVSTVDFMSRCQQFSITTDWINEAALYAGTMLLLVAMSFPRCAYQNCSKDGGSYPIGHFILSSLVGACEVVI